MTLLALSSAWLGLIVFVLSLTIAGWPRAFNDWTLPAALYGAVLAITFGGLALMRRPQPGDDTLAAQSQSVQAKVGIGLAMAAVAIAYAMMKLATPVARGTA